MNDKELKDALSKWQPEMPEEPGFHRAVFQRIHHVKEVSPVTDFIRGFIDLVTRPTVGIPAALATLAISAGLAIHNGTESRDETWTSLAANYSQLINPMTHSE